MPCISGDSSSVASVGRDEKGSVLKVPDVGEIGYVAHYASKLRLVMQCDDEPLDRQFIFRGVSSPHKVDIESGAADRLRSAKKWVQRDFIDYHVNLVQQARHNRYQPRRQVMSDLAKWHDLEILAELQHYGAATCLIDFTTNFLVALYFASAPKGRDTKGQVFIVDLLRRPNDEFFYINELRAENTIDVLLKKRTRKLDDFINRSNPRIWIWKPGKINDRIRRQGSVFLFSLAKLIGPERDDTNVHYSAIDILPHHKIHLRKELERYFGLSPETVFDDLPGFAAEVHSRRSPIVGDDSVTMTCLAQGKQYYRQARYLAACECFSQVVKCAEQHRKGSTEQYKCPHQSRLEQTACGDRVEALFRRGLARSDFAERAHSQDSHDYYYLARADFEEVCNSTSDDLMASGAAASELYKKAYRYVIEAYYNVRDFKGALEQCEDYKKKALLRQEDQEQQYLALLATELTLLVGDRDKFLAAWANAADRAATDSKTNYHLLLTFFGELGRLLFETEQAARRSSMDKLVYDKFEPLFHWDFTDIEWAVEHARAPNPMCENSTSLLVRAEIALAKKMQDQILEQLVFSKDPFLTIETASELRSAEGRFLAILEEQSRVLEGRLKEGLQRAAKEYLSSAPSSSIEVGIEHSLSTQAPLCDILRRPIEIATDECKRVLTNAAGGETALQAAVVAAVDYFLTFSRGLLTASIVACHDGDKLVHYQRRAVQTEFVARLKVQLSKIYQDKVDAVAGGGG